MEARRDRRCAPARRPLAEVLERAGIRRGAVDVMPEGLDAYEMNLFPAVVRHPVRVIA